MGKSPTPIDTAIGGKIRFYRCLRGLKQEELARRIGVSAQQLQKYEKGVNRIGASNLYQLAQGLNVPMQDFFGDNPLPAKTDGRKLQHVGNILHDLLALHPAQREAVGLLIGVLNRTKASR